MRDAAAYGFAAGGAHDGVGRDVDARALDLAEVQLAHAVGVDDRDLDVEAAVGVAQHLDVVGGAHDGRQRTAGSSPGPASASVALAREPPEADLGHERRAGVAVRRAATRSRSSSGRRRRRG